jgi:hypothetical protein
MPHIFLDSTNSSVNSDWTRTSTPHMFLSYANPDATRSSRALHETNQERGCAASNTKKSHRKRGSGTPHLFLHMADNSISDDNTTTNTTTESSERRRQDINRFSGWGTSLDDFEVECKLYMQTYQGLPAHQATTVSAAIRKEATPAGGTHDLDHRYVLYASFLDQALSSSPNKNKKHHSEARAGNITSMSNLTDSGDKDTIQSQMESLKSQVQRQQEELTFLRCATKSLILSSDHEPRRENQPIGSVDKYQNAIVPDNKTHMSPLRDEHHHQDAGIPTNIDISHLAVIVDDMTEALSVLTLSEDMATKSLQPPENQLVDIHPTSNLAVSRKHIPPPHIYSTHGTRNPDLDVDTSKLLGTTNTSTVRSSCMATMQLVCLVRTDMTTHHHSATIPVAASNTELQKGGEIQSHHDRVRGMNFQLYFKHWGTTLQGRYNGRISPRTGLPHGSGVLRFENRDMYIGEFVDGALHGEGTLFARTNDSNNNNKLLTLRGFFHQNEFLGWNEEQRSSCSEDAKSAGNEY